jgi:hypothetical protein
LVGHWCSTCPASRLSSTSSGLQELRPDAFVCVAGYGDGGPGYIPTAAAYFEGGYETTVALSGPGSEALLNQAMARLLKRE